MSITAETISLIIGLASFLAAIIFFFAARESEINTTKLLEKINEKTDILNNVTNKMLEKAFDHISAREKQLIDGILKLKHKEPIYIQDITDEVSLKLMLYSYVIRTLFLATVIQIFPNEKSVYLVSDAVLEQGRKDYYKLKEDIDNIDPTKLKNAPNYQSYISDRNTFEEILNTNT